MDRAAFRARCGLTAGIALGLAVPLLAVEVYVRLTPPPDVRAFFYEARTESGLTFKPDPDLGADFSSFEQLHARYRDQFQLLETPGRPVWAFFGNSFVRGNGMLADTVIENIPEVRVFVLRTMFILDTKHGRFVRMRDLMPINLNVAQIRAVLANGHRPARVFLSFLTIDLTPGVDRPLALSRVLVNSHGAVDYPKRMPPPPFDQAVRASGLARLAWLRSGRASEYENYSVLHERVRLSAVADDDMRRMTRVLGDTQRRYGVPITVILIPSRDEHASAAQDRMKELLLEQSLDIVDAREPILNAAKQNPDIYIPDGHLSPSGNRVLVDLILNQSQFMISQ